MKYNFVYMAFITQTVLHCRVPGGVCYGRALGTTPVFRLAVHAFVCILTALGDTCSRLVETEWSVACVFAVKHNGLDQFSLQDASGPPLVALALQTSPQSLPGMSRRKDSSSRIPLPEFLFLYSSPRIHPPGFLFQGSQDFTAGAPTRYCLGSCARVI